jgi:putative two-component system response regulator
MLRKSTDRELRILILEDFSPDAELMERELHKAKIAFSSKRVLTKEGFLKEIKDFVPNVILADYTLPQFNALEALRLLKEHKIDMPFILVTGSQSEEVAVECMKEGADDYILKSSLKRLPSALLNALEKKEAEWEREKAEAELRQSFEKLRSAMEGTIQAMALTAEMRDPYIAGHQRRVAQLACAIAKEMGLPEEQIEGIRMAGIIHDIGKIYVPGEILSRPSQLTEIEFSLIKTHAKVGYDILRTIDFPYPVAQIVFQHHERMDGSGYPSGLRGQEILIEARVLGVADVVEAIASHRPYRPALGIDKALEEISQKRGILYDPTVVDACLKLFTEKAFKFE